VLTLSSRSFLSSPLLLQVTALVPLFDFLPAETISTIVTSSGSTAPSQVWRMVDDTLGAQAHRELPADPRLAAAEAHLQLAQ
jgi:hypothetical protein